MKHIPIQKKSTIKFKKINLDKLFLSSDSIFNSIKCYILFLITFSLLSVPTPPSLEELIKSSDLIAKTKLTKLKKNVINSSTISVNANVEFFKVYKGKDISKSNMDLAFMVLPELYGKFLKKVPEEGDYILFFNKKEIRDSKGNPKTIYILYDPNVFAFKEITSELESKLNKIEVK